jgi:hypothetical protein
MTCRAFPFCLVRQSSSLLSFVSFGYQFSSAICLFAPLAVKKNIYFKLFCHIIIAMSRQNRWLCWMVTLLYAVGMERITPKYIFF